MADLMYTDTPMDLANVLLPVLLPWSFLQAIRVTAVTCGHTNLCVDSEVSIDSEALAKT